MAPSNGRRAFESIRTYCRKIGGLSNEAIILTRILFSSRLWKVIFCLSALFAVIMASLPNPPLPSNPPDKLLHFFTFAALSFQSRLAFAASRTWVLILLLSGLGAAIELIQSIPALNRDASFYDWLADFSAICFTFACMSVASRFIRQREALAAKQKKGHSQRE
ncbi:hypothetical protein BPTFM16_02144 [Altererythrobacter insulae]|nr:hypothetical protein BPTFM16_02144 [Altererythrobacter insulae]